MSRFCFYLIAGFTLMLFGASAATLTVQTNVLGVTPSVLAYNAGHFAPGSNTKDWWRYSGTTGARVFITPSIIEPSDDIPGRGDGVTDQASFLTRKAALRGNPLNTNYINWPYFNSHYNQTDVNGSNILNVNDACAKLRSIGVRILACISASAATFPINDTNDWAGKWEIWQHFYAQAFYLSREFQVEHYQMYNEPNLSGGPTEDVYLQRLQIVSDAMQCAVKDMDAMYGKILTPMIFAPVSAGNAYSHYSDWGRLVVTNRHVDFLGQSNANFWVMHKYDYHEYNSSPAAFGANITTLHNLLAADMAPETRFSTAITEFNVHTAGTFDTLTDTLDTPFDYSRFGSIAVSLTKNLCDELYCFKFSQTLNTTTVKKNGMHFVDNTNAPYNIGGVTKAGEVWRLFNQATAPNRLRLNVAQGTGATALDVQATFDPASRCYWVFSANNTLTNVPLTLDLSAWNLPTNQPVMLQEVSEGIWGGARALGTITNGLLTAGTQMSNTVWLFTVPTKPEQAAQTIYATDDATVEDGLLKAFNYGLLTNCVVKNNSTNSTFRNATLLKFHLPLYYHPDTQIALLAVRASSLNGATNVQAHVYGLANTNWNQSTVTWASTTNLAQNAAPGINYTNNYILDAGNTAQLVGELVADNTAADRYIDVTKYLHDATNQDVSFLLARETRFYGDAQNNDGMSIVSKEGNATNAPRLILIRLKDTDGDGLSDEAETTIFNTDPNLADTDHDGVNDGQEVLINKTDPGSIAPQAPALLSQPQDQSAFVDDTVDFEVNASGTSPLTYQWYFNATNKLSDATNSDLTLDSVQLSDSGSYTVVVTNVAGSATSANAVLVVQSLPPPPLPAYEPFNLSPGLILSGQGTWVLTGGTSGTTESGSLTNTDLLTPAGNRLTWGNAAMSLRLPLNTNVTSEKLYFSFLMRVDTLGSSMSTNGTLAGLAVDTSTTFAYKVNIQTNAAGGYLLGVSKAGGTNFGLWSSQNFSVGETVFVAGCYSFNTNSATDDTLDLWLNPAASSFGTTSPPPPVVVGVGSGGTDSATINRFFFRSSGSSSSPAKIAADEVRIGYSWADITVPAHPTLTFFTDDTDIYATWPTNYDTFTLQSTPVSATPYQWTPLADQPVIVGNRFSLLLDTSDTGRLFRLVH